MPRAKSARTGILAALRFVRRARLMYIEARDLEIRCRLAATHPDVPAPTQALLLQTSEFLDDILP